MDGTQLGVHSTQLYPGNADLSQLAPVLLIPTPQTNPSLPPKSVLPTFFGEHQIPLPSVPCDALAQPPTKSIGHELGARPKRDRQPPVYYGIQMPQQQLAQSHRSHTQQEDLFFQVIS